MKEEEILARARQEVAARKQAAAEQRWSGSVQWGLLLLLLAGLVALLAAPASLPDTLDLAMSGVNGQRPGHAYFAGGRQLPLEARTTGIYGGFLLALLWVLLRHARTPEALAGIHRTRWLAPRPLTIVVLLMFASMVGDGVNSTLTDLGLPHPYQTTNLHRLITGLLSGTALAVVLVWLLGRTALPRPEHEPRYLLPLPWELAGPLLLAGLLAALVLNGAGWVYYPVALISSAGVVLAVGGLVLLLVLQMGGLSGRVTRAGLLVAPGALAVLLACGFLAAMAALRWVLS